MQFLWLVIAISFLLFKLQRMREFLYISIMESNKIHIRICGISVTTALRLLPHLSNLSYVLISSGFKSQN
ncbi:MAG: hypothetical protein A3C53_07645 [Omnitrophica WOR_2 bacterium RIFCSPHIGHO2_02_FULL_68_15]|nr:MAG: hypothetical protein A3C53_07645 [Omnitrophica WOR_2 bacterium RIFCSPHIGHO2_02_FULL_68_15]